MSKKFQIPDYIKEQWRTWPAPVEARPEIKKFTGGALTPKTLMMLDSKGEGPEGRFRLGRTTVYPIDKLITWLEEKMAKQS